MSNKIEQARISLDGAIGWASKKTHTSDGSEFWYTVFLPYCVPDNHEYMEVMGSNKELTVMHIPTLQTDDIEILKPNQQYIDLWKEMLSKFYASIDRRGNVTINQQFFPKLIASGAVKYFTMETLTKLYPLSFMADQFLTLDGIRVQFESDEALDRAYHWGVNIVSEQGLCWHKDNTIDNLYKLYMKKNDEGIEE